MSKLLQFLHQRKVYTEDLFGRHALCMLGRTLHMDNVWAMYVLSVANGAFLLFGCIHIPPIYLSAYFMIR